MEARGDAREAGAWGEAGGAPASRDKEQYALTAPPRKISEPGAENAKLQALLDDLDRYTRDPAKFGRAGAMLAEADEEPARAEEKMARQ